jgi:hypothetical protein
MNGSEYVNLMNDTILITPNVYESDIAAALLAAVVLRSHARFS